MEAQSSSVFNHHLLSGHLHTAFELIAGSFLIPLMKRDPGLQTAHSVYGLLENSLVQWAESNFMTLPAMDSGALA